MTTTATEQKPTVRSADVRTWARTNGHTVKDTGRLPEHVTKAYEAAHPGVSA